MKPVTIAWLLATSLTFASALPAQETDQAEAHGIYRARDASPAGPAVPAASDSGASPATARVSGLVQVVDSAAADTAAADTVVGDTVVGDTAAAGAKVADTAAARGSTVPRDSAGRADTLPRVGTGRDTLAAADSARIGRVEEVEDDTSLTARMDVSRGGGLRREEFPDLRESAALTGRYTVFLDLVGRDPRGAALRDTVSSTVLAPIDSAFSALPASAVDLLRSDSTVRARWVEGLLLPGDLPMAALLDAGEARTADGTAMAVTRGRKGEVKIGEAGVVQPDVTARNGVLHGVDRVTLPDAGGGETTSTAP